MSKFDDLAPAGNDWMVRELKELRRELEELRSARSNEAATIRRGGLTVTDDGYIRMVDDNGTQILYIGPDVDGTQIARLRRENGAFILYTAKTVSGNNYWALTDNTNRIVVSDDAASGIGLARPWLPVHLNRGFVTSAAAGSVASYSYLPVSAVTSETTLWDGYASVSHPKLTTVGIWGQAVSSVTGATFRIRFDGTEIGSWSTASGELSSSFRGPYDVTDFTNKDWVRVTVTCVATGTGSVACEVRGMYLHQT